MENEPPPLTPTGDAPETTSLFDRFMGVFAQPGQTFAEVIQHPVCIFNWVVPLVLMCLVGGAAVVGMLSQPAIFHQVQERQDQAIEKSMKDLPPAQRQQVLDRTAMFRTPLVIKLSGFFSAVVTGAVWPFFLALVFWLVARNLYKAEVDYLKVLEVCCLVGLIQVVGVVINTCLIVGTGNLALTVGPALLVRGFDATNKAHLALAACGVFSLWHAVVLSVGLAKLARCSLAVALLFVFIPWALFQFAIVTLRARGAL